MVDIDRSRELEDTRPQIVFEEDQLLAIINPPDPHIKDRTLIPGIRHKNNRRCWLRPIDGGFQFVRYCSDIDSRNLSDVMDFIELGESKSDNDYTYYPECRPKQRASVAA